MTATYSAPVTVLGAGSYGTALAIALARNGHKTYLWGHQPEAMAKLASERMNQTFLPDIPFPEALEIESDLAQALSKARDLPKYYKISNRLFALSIVLCGQPKV